VQLTAPHQHRRWAKIPSDIVVLRWLPASEEADASSGSEQVGDVDWPYRPLNAEHGPLANRIRHDTTIGAAMAFALPEMEKRFGAEAIGRIRAFE
jgi:hypothetical protein